MDKQGKAWGETTMIFNDQRVSMHYLDIKKGGYCSEHKHTNKTNLFYVIEGELMIRFWRKGDHTDDTILRAGESMNIPTHIWHQFIGLTDCRCIEIYETGLWTADIERRTVGGSDYERISKKENLRKSKTPLGQSSKKDAANTGNEESLDSREETAGSNEGNKTGALEI